MHEPGDKPAGRGEIVLYTTEDGAAQFFLRAEGGTVWMTQAELASLFQTTPQNITLHIGAVYAQEALKPETSCKREVQVQYEGGRRVRRSLKFYNLDVVMAVGCRVRSARGAQFRRWAATLLQQYLVKGFVLDDARLQDPASQDYYDELLLRIRDIRTSDKRFYQKVRDLLSLSADHDADPIVAGAFFAEVYDKMLYAVTRQTAAEIVVSRADPRQPHMALRSWAGSRPRRADVVVARNYLEPDELEHLNRIVAAFLEFAELRAHQRKALTVAQWRRYVDSFISFNDSPVMSGPGAVRYEDMVNVAHRRYERFDARRRRKEALDADAQDEAGSSETRAYPKGTGIG